MHFRKSIAKDEIEDLPRLVYEGEIQVISSFPKAIKAAQEILDSKPSVVGFDTETRPSFTKGKNYKVALLQLAIENKVYLFRLNRSKIPNEIVTLFEDPNIIKAGVAIDHDIKMLNAKKPFKAEGFVDLAKLAKDKGFENFSLRALTAIFLAQRLSKRARTSNWENVKLTESQINYAATDAYVGLEIYKTLSSL